MDTRVKERLIGAVVLVAILVALVPELLTGPPPEHRPAPTDGPLRTYTIDLEPQGQTAPAPGTMAPIGAPDEGAGTRDAADETSDGEPMPADAENTAESTPQAEQPDAPSVAAATPATNREPEPRPVPEASKPKALPATAAQPAPQPAPAASSEEGAGWAVQLGSFANQQNAQRLVTELRQRGYRAFVARHQSGSTIRYRVRVGPENTRERADALAARLKREGRQVSVVSQP